MLFITLTKPTERTLFAGINNAIKTIGTLSSFKLDVPDEKSVLIPKQCVQALIRKYLEKEERNHHAAVALYATLKKQEGSTHLTVAIKKTDEHLEARVATFETTILTTRPEIDWVTQCLKQIFQKEGIA